LSAHSRFLIADFLQLIFRNLQLNQTHPKVCTITTTSNVEVSNASKPPTNNGKMIGVEKAPTPSAKSPKTTKTFSNKSAKKFQSMGDNGPM
jgi:hypothetical protein